AGSGFHQRQLREREVGVPPRGLAPRRGSAGLRGRGLLVHPHAHPSYEAPSGRGQARGAQRLTVVPSRAMDLRWILTSLALSLPAVARDAPADAEASAPSAPAPAAEAQPSEPSAPEG